MMSVPIPAGALQETIANATIHVIADVAESFLVSLITAALMMGVMLLLERRVPPARPRAVAHVGMNLAYTVASLAVVAALRPLTLVLALSVSRALGAGFITFAPGFGGWITAFVSVLLFTDLLEFLWHRAQHTFGPLWKMHELHHSAEFYDVTLSYFHFWLEPVIKISLLYPLIGVVFRVPESVATAVAVIFMVNHHVAHLNARIHFGRFWWLVSSPHYHRLHHSRHREHYNRNFCDMLPLWDLLCGTFERISQDRYVDIGVESVPAPRTLATALMWPWRNQSVDVESRLTKPAAE